MKLLTKAKLAREINLASLFKNFGGTVDFAALQKKSWAYCTGKYKRTMLDKTIGDAISDLGIPVWYESRTDPDPFYEADRHYIVLRCVDEYRLSHAENEAYQIAKRIWKHLLEKHLEKSAS